MQEEIIERYDDKGMRMKIKSIVKIGTQPVYDISVKDAEHYVLENGIVTHNTGSYYSADTILVIGRQQEKDGTELIGFNFVINIEKSRRVREKQKIILEIAHGEGINRWSGLMDMALMSGHVIKPKNARFSKVNKETGEIDSKIYTIDETQNKEFWGSILASTSFKEWVKNTYSVSNGKILKDEDIDNALASLDTEEPKSIVSI